MLYKEFRELILPMSFVLLVSIGVVGYWEMNGEFHPTFLQDELFTAIVVLSVGAGLVVGACQSLRERTRDQRAFLICRGVSATRIFLARVGAGGLVYSFLCAVPILYFAGKCAFYGIERLPYDRMQFLPALLAIPTSLSSYFAVIAIRVRQASIWKTGLLPMVMPALLVWAATVLPDQWSARLPVSVFIATTVVTTLVGVAAWGEFIGNGESQSRPVAGSIALGMLIHFAMANVVAVGFHIATTPLWDHFVNAPGASYESTSHYMNTDGQVIRTKYIWRNNPLEGQSGREYLEAVNLDTGQRLPHTNLAPGVAPSPQLEMTQIVAPDDLSIPPTPILEHHDSTLTPDGRSWILWLFSATQQRFVGYLAHRDRMDQLVRWELVGILTPDGFASLGEESDSQFTKLLEADHYSRDWPPKAAYFQHREMLIDESMEKQQDSKRLESFFVFQDAIYAIDFRRRSIRRHLVGRDGMQIRGVVPIGQRLPEIEREIFIRPPQRFSCVVYDGVIDVHDHELYFSALIDDHEGDRLFGEYVCLPGKYQRTITIPESIKGLRSFSVAELSDGSLVAYSTEDYRGSRFIVAKHDGTIVSERQIEPSPRPLQWIDSVAAGLIGPPLILAVELTLPLFRQQSNGLGEIGERLFFAARERPAQFAVYLAPSVILPLICVVIASRTAKRYDFCARERMQWLVWSFLLSVPGLLTLYALQSWPPRITCGSCGAVNQLATRDVCSECGHTTNPVQVNGTEVLSPPTT